MRNTFAFTFLFLFAVLTNVMVPTMAHDLMTPDLMTPDLRDDQSVAVAKNEVRAAPRNATEIHKHCCKSDEVRASSSQNSPSSSCSVDCGGVLFYAAYAPRLALKKSVSGHERDHASGMAAPALLRPPIAA